MLLTLHTGKHVFINRSEPTNYIARSADVWWIGNIWHALKEKLRRWEYNNIEQLKNDIKKEWNKLSVSLCRWMIDHIAARLKLIIDQDDNQIDEHW